MKILRFVGSAALSVALFTSSSAQVSGVTDSVPGISAVVINNDSVIWDGNVMALSRPLKEMNFDLRYRDNNISFRIEPEEGPEYRFQLAGFDKKPTQWRHLNYKEYTSLPAGSYTLHTWYRTPGSDAREIDPVHFKVRSAWYWSKPAIAGYVILFFSAMWILYEIVRMRFVRKQHELEQVLNLRTEDLMAEKEKSETLLANVLPKNTADEIMAKGKATKIKYNFVTVLFSDIQGFTQIAEEMNPEVLIDELDKFFFHFDSVVEKYHIEKIKTIGDAYMCAGGLPEKNRTNPVEVILAALEMQQYMKQLKENSIVAGMKYWDIRIGIHTGTVVAGVVGQKKLSYDIWGDTVNTASRMESSGDAGKINISGTTYEFVKDFFVCEYRGKMPVKYKGEVEMYFIKEIIPELRDGNGLPNEKFRLKMLIIKLQDVEDVVNKVFTDEAPPELYFHNAQYAKSIIAQTELLAVSEHITEDVYISLKLAAMFLITGFITDYDRPAEAAAAMMDGLLPKFGFDDHFITTAKQYIFNSFKGVYATDADRILHDSRYDYLGRVDYIKMADKLLRERNEHGLKTVSSEWNGMQRSFLTEHDFLTKTGRLLRSVSVEEQIAGLEVYPV